MKRNTIYCMLLLAVSLLAGACKKELKPVTVVITDPDRHYGPVVQGELLSVTYEVENTGETPLFIREVQTSCGCIIPRDNLPIVILPRKSGFVHLDFNTIKNTGYVAHNVYCYGNFKDAKYIEMSFDTNVVPKADYMRDYEELWQEQGEVKTSVHSFVNGNSAQKGYYTDEHEDPREETKEKIQDAVDDHAF